jgi:hypothetical protein
MRNLRIKMLSKYFLYALLCVVFLGSCTIVEKEKTLVYKPFIVTYKFPDGAMCNGDYCSYKYTDTKGNVFTFCEYETMYKIGDTIK